MVTLDALRTRSESRPPRVKQPSLKARAAQLTLEAIREKKRPKKRRRIAKVVKSVEAEPDTGEDEIRMSDIDKFTNAIEEAEVSQQPFEELDSP